jgi:hypothetical protein
MQRKSGTRRRLLAGGVIVAAALGAVLAQLATGQTGPSPIPEGCQPKSPQPEAPLKLNTVVVANLAKTIAMEKEVFNCYDADGELAEIRDVETFIEVVERTGGRLGVETVTTVIEAATCSKDFKSGRVTCGTKDVPLGATTTPLAGCSPTRGTYPFEPTEQPSHPVEMNTVVMTGEIVKTIKVEKEVLDCGGDIGDLYLFTKIVEDRRGQRFVTLGKLFAGIICLKNTDGKHVSCKAFTPARA